MMTLLGFGFGFEWIVFSFCEVLYPSISLGLMIALVGWGDYLPLARKKVMEAAERHSDLYSMSRKTLLLLRYAMLLWCRDSANYVVAL